jgi:bifunctional enzyme CysN/CysC
VTQDVQVMVSWMTDTPVLAPRSRLIVKHTTRTVKAVVKDVAYRLDVNTLHRDEAATSLGLNQIGRVSLRLTQPIFCDPYARNRITGGLILIDEATNATVGAAMITDAS